MEYDIFDSIDLLMKMKREDGYFTMKSENGRDEIKMLPDGRVVIGDGSGYTESLALCYLPDFKNTKFRQIYYTLVGSGK